MFLATAWSLYAFESLNIFFNLYLRDLGWTFLSIGILGAANQAIAALSRIIGGYVGDHVDRKSLAAASMLVVSGFYLLIALSIHPVVLVLALLLYSTMHLVTSGSSAYVMNSIPQRHSGLALSLFTAGRAIGISALLALNILVPVIGFGAGFRFLALLASCVLMASAVVRHVWLAPSPIEHEMGPEGLLRNFLSENARALRVLVLALPGTLLVVLLDAVSDGLFKFGALLYANEFLNVSIPGIGSIMIFTLLFSVPLLIWVGRVADTRGLSSAADLVYAMMPLSTFLILVAPAVPMWAPADWAIGAESLFPGLGAVFTTVFLAIVLKYVNDILWNLVLITLIRKNLPSSDTSKFLALFWFLVALLTALGPVLGGLLFSFGVPSLVFVAALFLNVLILFSLHRYGLFARPGVPNVEDR